MKNKHVRNALGATAAGLCLHTFRSLEAIKHKLLHESCIYRRGLLPVAQSFVFLFKFSVIQNNCAASHLLKVSPTQSSLWIGCRREETVTNVVEVLVKCENELVNQLKSAKYNSNSKN